MTNQEYSPAGDPVYRYNDDVPKDFVPPQTAGEHLEAITDHIEKHIGPIDTVFHEILSSHVHIDVHWVRPTERFPFHTLVTSGMSDLPMSVPEAAQDHQYAELCILLPEEWPIDGTDYTTMEKAFKDENHYWPVRWLKTIARLPHEHNTWVGYGHTIPNGEEAAPFADNTKLGCMLLLPSLNLGSKFFTLKIDEEKTIRFYCLYPIYKEEMDLKLRKGSDALIAKFAKYQVTDVVDTARINTCLKKGPWGLW